ncbi:MAG: preprotein translocase subunit SecE [Burkholderiales bacterium]
MNDKIKLAVAALLVVAGIAGYYYLNAQPDVVRVLAILLGVAAGTFVAWLSQPGKVFFVFAKEAWTEATKVVWPTRKETMQTTTVVFVLVAVMAVFMFLVDGSLTWLVSRLMGGGAE